jgi:hybrid cluster-associated redox disulfide protein
MSSQTKQQDSGVQPVSNTPITKVEKDTNLAELLMEHPGTAEILLDYGLHCVGCFANSFDTIEMGAKIHGFSDEEVEEMLTRLNEFIEFGE